MLSEIEENGQFAPIGESRMGIPQFLEKGVSARLERGDPSRRRVLEKTGDQIDGFQRRPCPKHLDEKKMKENPLGKQQVPLHENVFEAKDTHTERTYTKEEGKK